MTKIGILGGGQLAQMLALAAHPLQIKPYILSSNNDDPAAQVTQWHYLNSSKQKGPNQFYKNINLLTFESEFVPVESLKKILKTHPHIQVFPSIKNMEQLQYRHRQKKFLEKFKIPTARYLTVKNFSDLLTAFHQFKTGFVLKKSFGGYDGFGTFYIRDKHDLKHWENHWKTALSKSNSRTNSISISNSKSNSNEESFFIAEELISFKKEMSLILIRSKNGDICIFPLVESHQKNSQCDWVCGPIHHSKLKSLTTKLKKAIADSNYVGCIAFELFDTGTQLLVNEVAPRVHNTGHHSQISLSYSQFQLHLMAGLGHSLPTKMNVLDNFVMVNLVPPLKNQNHLSPNFLDNHSWTKNKVVTAVQWHWYGKNELRHGRKMGHVNYLGKNYKSLLKQALKDRTNGFKRIKKTT